MVLAERTSVRSVLRIGKETGREHAREARGLFDALCVHPFIGGGDQLCAFVAARELAEPTTRGGGVQIHVRGLEASDGDGREFGRLFCVAFETSDAGAQ